MSESITGETERLLCRACLMRPAAVMITIPDVIAVPACQYDGATVMLRLRHVYPGHQGVEITRLWRYPHERTS